MRSKDRLWAKMSGARHHLFWRKTRQLEVARHPCQLAGSNEPCPTCIRAPDPAPAMRRGEHQRNSRVPEFSTRLISKSGKMEPIASTADKDNADSQTPCRNVLLHRSTTLRPGSREIWYGSNALRSEER